MTNRIALIPLVALAGFALAAPGSAQRPDDQLSPQSLSLQKEGRALYSAGKLDEAEGYFETALAVDPRNRAAFVDIARVAEKQGLFGKAIQMTNRALALEPNDKDAIAVQGDAMVQLGALSRAKANLAKLQQICTQCPEVAQLSASITRGPKAPPVAKAEAKTEQD